MNMNKQSNKMELLGTAPIPKALLALGLPTMIGMMINAVYNLVDAYFVGSLGTAQMGAISIAFPLGQVIVGLGLLFGNGAASYISRLLGQGDKNKADTVASTALYGSLLVGAAMILCALIFLKPILLLLGATESILPHAISYSRIYILFSIFNIFNVAMNNIITSEGAAKTTMYTLLAGAFLNMILDPFFITILHLGVAGAAAATAISQIFSTILYLHYLFSGKSIFHFRRNDCHFSKEILSEIFKIGVPTLVFQLLTSLSITLVNMKAAPYGDSVIAAMGTVSRIISLGTLIVFGFIKGFQPVAGYNYGAKNYARLRESINTATLWTTLFCIAVGVLLLLFPQPIISQFTKDDRIFLTIGQKALRANGLTFMLFGFSTVYSSLFLSLGRAKEGCFLGICRQGIFFIPVILLAPVFLGVNGIIYTQPLADIMTAIVTIFMAHAVSLEIRTHLIPVNEESI